MLSIHRIEFELRDQQVADGTRDRARRRIFESFMSFRSGTKSERLVDAENRCVNSEHGGEERNDQRWKPNGDHAEEELRQAFHLRGEAPAGGSSPRKLQDQQLRWADFKSLRLSNSVFRDSIVVF